MKFYILGSTRGLGQHLAEHFVCERFDRPFDLNTDIEEICNNINDDSVIILNAHASQLTYVEKLKDRCKLVIMGSIAAVNFDPNMPNYSQEKYTLEKTIQQISCFGNSGLLGQPAPRENGAGGRPKKSRS
jgi:short-subunit dehydrogenase